MSGLVPQRGVRHPITAVVEARRLSAGGWSNAEIGRRLGVSQDTVGRWVDPERAERKRRQQQAGNRRQSARRGANPLGSREAAPEFKFGRVVALRDLGLSWEAIAKLMRHDFGDDISGRQLEYAATTGQYPRRRPRRAGALPGPRRETGKTREFSRSIPGSATA